MKKAARKHNPYRTFAEYEIQEREIPAYVLKAMRDLNMKSSKLSGRELERHEAKRDVWREVLDGIDEIKAGGLDPYKLAFKESALTEPYHKERHRDHPLIRCSPL